MGLQAVVVVVVVVLDRGPSRQVLVTAEEGYGVQEGYGRGVLGCRFLRHPNLAVGR